MRFFRCGEAFTILSLHMADLGLVPLDSCPIHLSPWLLIEVQQSQSQAKAQSALAILSAHCTRTGCGICGCHQTSSIQRLLMLELLPRKQREGLAQPMALAVVEKALEKSHKALTLFLVEVEPALVTILEIVLVPLTGSLIQMIGCDGAIKHLGDVFLGGRHSMSWIALKISRATAGAMAFVCFHAGCPPFGKVMPSNF